VNSAKVSQIPDISGGRAAPPSRFFRGLRPPSRNDLLDRTFSTLNFNALCFNDSYRVCMTDLPWRSVLQTSRGAMDPKPLRSVLYKHLGHTMSSAQTNSRSTTPHIILMERALRGHPEGRLKGSSARRL